MDIETRLESLENDIRRQKDDLRLHKRLWMGAASLLVAVLLTWALPPPKSIVKTIAAQEFLLKDSKGKILSRWGINEERPYFTMGDKKGIHELGLGFDDDGSLGLFLIDRNEFKKDKLRLFVGTQKESVGITVADKGGTPRTAMWIEEEEGVGEVAISIFDPSEKTRATLFFSKEGESNLVLLDSEKKIIWQALPKPE
jgi:hypothetical protein